MALKRTPTMLIVVVWPVALGAVGLVLAVLWYAGQNDSGHSGFSPFLVVPVFLFVLVAAAVGFFANRARPIRLPGVIGLVAGIFGLCLPFALHHASILREYEAWCQSGMPSPPAWRVPFVLGYGVVFGVALFVGAWLSVRGRAEAAPPTRDDGS